MWPHQPSRFRWSFVLIGAAIASGAAALNAQPTCIVTCPPGAVISNEPLCGPDYVDQTNAGCAGAPPRFEPLACGDTICGQAGTFVLAGEPTRDLDWYRFEVAANALLEWQVRAEFSVQISLHANLHGGAADCPTGQLTVLPPLILTPDIPACTDAVARFWVQPGIYYASVAPRLAVQITPCAADYVATLRCLTAPTCPTFCEAPDLGETEPLCSSGYIDQSNAGCQGTPASFQRLTLLDAPVSLCGTSGTFLAAGGGAARRDEDWFLISNPLGPRWARLRAEASFPFRMLSARINGSPPSYLGCTASIVQAAEGWPCQRGDVIYPLPAGDSLIALMPRGLGGVVCGRIYRIELSPLTPNCTPTCLSGARAENEPTCGPDYIDLINSGCDSAPPRFTPLFCPGTRVCGTTGSYSSGLLGARRTDRDWLSFTLTQSRRVRVAIDSPGRLTAEFVRLTGGCAARTTVTPPGVVPLPTCAAGMIEACLPAGDYAILLQPADPDLPCHWPWTLDFQCVDCGPTCTIGDSTGDGAVNFDDIGCFVASLVSTAAWSTCGTTLPPGEYFCANDVNCDGAVDFLDIESFVACLTAGACAECP